MNIQTLIKKTHDALGGGDHLVIETITLVTKSPQAMKSTHSFMVALFSALLGKGLDDKLHLVPSTKPLIEEYLSSIKKPIAAPFADVRLVRQIPTGSKEHTTPDNVGQVFYFTEGKLVDRGMYILTDDMVWSRYTRPDHETLRFELLVTVLSTQAIIKHVLDDPKVLIFPSTKGPGWQMFKIYSDYYISKEAVVNNINL